VLKSLDIKAFGRIKELRIDFKARINLIFGQNEAGKSTLMAAVSSVLMGFSPSKGDNHPYMPWGHEAIVLEAEIRNDKEDYRVQRTLKSAASGYLFANQNKEKINNLPLPQMQFLSKEVFSAVFAMKHDTLNGEILKTKSWQEIKEHFMFALGQDQIQSPSKVLEILENQKKSLLKQDNKGIQKIKVLKKDLKESQYAIEEAVTRFEAYEKKLIQLEHLNKRYQDLKSKRDDLGLENSQLELVLPLKRINNQIALLRDKNPLLDNHATLKKINERSKTRLLLQESLRQWQEQLTENLSLLESLHEKRPVLTTADQALFSDRSDCESLLKAVDEISVLDSKITRDSESIQTTDSYIRLQFLDAFLLDYEERYQEKMLELNISEIAEQFQRIRIVKQQKDEPLLESKFDGMTYLILMSILWVSTCVFVLMNALSTSLTLTILCFISGFFALSVWILKQHLRTEKWHSRLKAKTSDQQLIRDVCQSLMDSMAPLLRDDNQILLLVDGFIHQLIQLKTLFEKKEWLQKSVSEASEHLSAILDRIEIFEHRHQLKLPEATQRLDIILQNKQQLIAIEEKAQFISQRIQTVKEKMELTTEKLKEEHNRIECNLGQAFEVYLAHEGFHIETLGRYEELAEEKEILMATLGTSPQYDDWSLEAVLNRKNKVSSEMDDGKQQEERLYGDIRAEESDCRHLREKDDYLELVANRTAIEIALEEATVEYTRVSILIELIRYTDEVYKAMYQPEYLKQASFYFRTITHHRYTEIMIDDQDQVLLMTSDQAMPIETLQTLSSGTLNQLYFSLFLSLTDTLDPDCLLPLFLDDVFLSWDYERFLAGVDIIHQVSDKRQIFLLSCNLDSMKRLEEAFNMSAYVLKN
jgi:uncharacterized protein YhaN